jgi:hypothetical protein
MYSWHRFNFIADSSTESSKTVEQLALYLSWEKYVRLGWPVFVHTVERKLVGRIPLAV